MSPWPFPRRAPTPGVPAGPTLSLLLAGDVMLAQGVDERLATAPPASVWGDTLDLLRAADARIANLECVLARGGAPWRPGVKGCHFRGDPARVESLVAAGITAVALANNHAYDYGPDALGETLDLLDRAGIARAGAGRDDAEAYRPAFFEAAGARVALVALTDNEPDAVAGPGRPGTAYARCLRREVGGRRVLATVAEARRSADLVVVSAHWGGNWGDVPRPHHRSFGRALVAAGADVVFGHSAHVTRGIRWRRGRPILFSAGDFLDDYPVRAAGRNDLAFAFRVDVEGGRVARVRCHPTAIRDGAVHRAVGADAEDVVARMERLCAGERSRTRRDAADGSLVVEP